MNLQHCLIQQEIWHILDFNHELFKKYIIVLTISIQSVYSQLLYVKCEVPLLVYTFYLKHHTNKE